MMFRKHLDLADAAKSNPCLITGCRVVIEQEGKSLWGDLHMQGLMFVFVGCLTSNKATGEQNYTSAWEYAHVDLLSGSEKQITIKHGMPYFERRGIIVFDPLHCTFNQLAREHLQEILNHA